MTPWQSDPVGSFYNYLPRGCEICMQGAGLVLFVTGLCERRCFYCPLSEERKDKDQAFANEQPVSCVADIIREANLIGALGTGITGGEPLLNVDRVVEYIEALKREFGKEHHIHLYTGILPGRDVLTRLKSAGLDEIRFHPQSTTDASGLRKTLAKAKEVGLEAGVEMPAMGPAPAILDAVRDTGTFLNLNELEFSDTNQEHLRSLGFCAHDLDCGAEGSEEIARKSFMADDARIHFCPSRFKDAVQLRERLKRRAQRVSRAFDIPTEDGTLVYGEIAYPDGPDRAIAALNELDVPEEMYSVLPGRIEIAAQILEEISKDLKIIGCNISIVERYPLEDGLVVERIPL